MDSRKTHSLVMIAGNCVRAVSLLPVALAVLFGATRTFGYIAMLWLFGVAANLISTGTYYDIAVRDILLGCGAFALARVTEARQSVVVVTDEYTEDYRTAA